MMTAVEDSTKPAPATKAVTSGRPKSNIPAAVSSATASETCASPRPKICPRIVQSFCGRSSSPMMKRNITTPSSAKCRIVSGSVNRPSSEGPTSAPAAKYPSTDPRPRRRNSGTAMTAAPIRTTAGPITGPKPATAIALSDPS